MTAALLVGAALFVVAFDFQNLLSWWRGRVITPGSEGTDDYTIVVPLYGDPRYLDGRAALLTYQARVLIAAEISAPGMRAFARQLEEEGWRVAPFRCADPNPSGLLGAALGAVTTSAVVRLDADTLPGPGLGQAVASFLADGADIASVKVEAANLTTACSKLQHLEYRMAMLSRHYRPWLTSGACLVGRTVSLREIMKRHSLWTPGEDIETGRIAFALKMRIRHLDTVVRTDVPETWPALVRQRRLWWAGSFRHWIVNVDRNLFQLRALTLYYLVALWISVQVRWWHLIAWGDAPRTIPLLLVVYLATTVVTNWQVRSGWMLLMPIYAGVQTLVFPALGAITFARLAWKRKRLGRYRFGLLRRSLDEPTRPGRSPAGRRPRVFPKAIPLLAILGLIAVLATPAALETPAHELEPPVVVPSR